MLYVCLGIPVANRMIHAHIELVRFLIARGAKMGEKEESYVSICRVPLEDVRSSMECSIFLNYLGTCDFQFSQDF